MGVYEYQGAVGKFRYEHKPEQYNKEKYYNQALDLITEFNTAFSVTENNKNLDTKRRDYIINRLKTIIDEAGKPENGFTGEISELNKLLNAAELPEKPTKKNDGKIDFAERERKLKQRNIKRGVAGKTMLDYMLKTGGDVEQKLWVHSANGDESLYKECKSVLNEVSRVSEKEFKDDTVETGEEDSEGREKKVSVGRVFNSDFPLTYMVNILAVRNILNSSSDKFGIKTLSDKIGKVREMLIGYDELYSTLGNSIVRWKNEYLIKDFPNPPRKFEEYEKLYEEGMEKFSKDSASNNSKYRKKFTEYINKRKDASIKSDESKKLREMSIDELGDLVNKESEKYINDENKREAIQKLIDMKLEFENMKEKTRNIYTGYDKILFEDIYRDENESYNNSYGYGNENYKEDILERNLLVSGYDIECGSDIKNRLGRIVSDGEFEPFAQIYKAVNTKDDDASAVMISGIRERIKEDRYLGETYKGICELLKRECPEKDEVEIFKLALGKISRATALKANFVQSYITNKLEYDKRLKRIAMTALSDLKNADLFDFAKTDSNTNMEPYESIMKRYNLKKKDEKTKKDLRTLEYFLRSVLATDGEEFINAPKGEEVKDDDDEPTVPEPDKKPDKPDDKDKEQQQPQQQPQNYDVMDLFRLLLGNLQSQAGNNVVIPPQGLGMLYQMALNFNGNPEGLMGNFANLNPKAFGATPVNNVTVNNYYGNGGPAQPGGNYFNPNPEPLLPETRELFVPNDSQVYRLWGGYRPPMEMVNQYKFFITISLRRLLEQDNDKPLNAIEINFPDNVIVYLGKRFRLPDNFVNLVARYDIFKPFAPKDIRYAIFYLTPDEFGEYVPYFLPYILTVNDDKVPEAEEVLEMASIEVPQTSDAVAEAQPDIKTTVTPPTQPPHKNRVVEKVLAAEEDKSESSPPPPSAGDKEKAKELPDEPKILPLVPVLAQSTEKSEDIKKDNKEASKPAATNTAPQVSAAVSSETKKPEQPSVKQVSDDNLKIDSNISKKVTIDNGKNVKEVYLIIWEQFKQFVNLLMRCDLTHDTEKVVRDYSFGKNISTTDASSLKKEIDKIDDIIYSKKGFSDAEKIENAMYRRLNEGKVRNELYKATGANSKEVNEKPHIVIDFFTSFTKYLKDVVKNATDDDGKLSSLNNFYFVPGQQNAVRTLQDKCLKDSVSKSDAPINLLLRKSKKRNKK